MRVVKGLKFLKRVKAAKGKGISQIIATVLTFMFGIVMITIVLNVINPTFKRVKDTSAINDAFLNLEIINSAIEEVSSESEGSRRIVSISVADGTYRTDNTYEWLYFEYTPDQNIYLTGSKGDINVERDLQFLDYFNWYVNGAMADSWTNISGQWVALNYKYSGTSGIAYQNSTDALVDWKLSGKITNVSGPTGGQIFVLPTNPEKLIAFWPFDNRTGNQAYDYSALDNNGTLTNMNTTGNSTSGWQNSTGCKAGVSCLQFDGVNDYVVVNSNSMISETEGTISLWVNFKEVDRNQIILISGEINADGESNNDHIVIMLEGATNKIKAGWYTTADSDWVYSSGAMVIDTWYHLVATHSLSENIVKIYVDKVLTIGDVFTGNAKTTWEDELRIGRSMGTATNPNVMNGTIDEVMIFNHSLSADEVQALYETSAKKLVVSGSQDFTNKTDVSIVLSNPYGNTKFDDIKVVGSQKELKMIIPYNNVDINGTLRLGKGEHKLEVRHMGTNTTSSKPVLRITNA